MELNNFNLECGRIKAACNTETFKFINKVLNKEGKDLSKPTKQALVLAHILPELLAYGEIVRTSTTEIGDACGCKSTLVNKVLAEAGFYYEKDRSTHKAGRETKGLFERYYQYEYIDDKCENKKKTSSVFNIVATEALYDLVKQELGMDVNITAEKLAKLHADAKAKTYTKKVEKRYRNVTVSEVVTTVKTPDGLTTETVEINGLEFAEVALADLAAKNGTVEVRKYGKVVAPAVEEVESIEEAVEMPTPEVVVENVPAVDNTLEVEVAEEIKRPQTMEDLMDLDLPEFPGFDFSDFALDDEEEEVKPAVVTFDVPAAPNRAQVKEEVKPVEEPAVETFANFTPATPEELEVKGGFYHYLQKHSTPVTSIEDELADLEDLFFDLSEDDDDVLPSEIEPKPVVKAEVKPVARQRVRMVSEGMRNGSNFEAQLANAEVDVEDNYDYSSKVPDQHHEDKSQEFNPNSKFPTVRRLAPNRVQAKPVVKAETTPVVKQVKEEEEVKPAVTTFEELSRKELTEQRRNLKSFNHVSGINRPKATSDSSNTFNRFEQKPSPVVKSTPEVPFNFDRETMLKKVTVDSKKVNTCGTNVTNNHPASILTQNTPEELKASRGIYVFNLAQEFLAMFPKQPNLYSKEVVDAFVEFIKFQD